MHGTDHKQQQDEQEVAVIQLCMSQVGVKQSEC